MAPASGYPGEATGDARGKAKKGKAGQRGVERGGRTLLRMNRLASVVRLYLAPSQVKLESVGLRIFWKRQFHRLASGRGHTRPALEGAWRRGAGRPRCQV